MKLNLIKTLNNLLKFFQQIILKFGLLGICFGSFTLVNAQNIKSLEKSATNLELEANKISREWNREAIRTYIDFYTQAAKLWEKSKNKQKSSDSYRKVARYENFLGNRQEVLRSLEKALETEESIQYIEGQIKTYSLFSDIYLKMGQKRKSETYFKKALRLSNKVDDPIAKAMSANSAAEFYYFEREFSTASTFYEKSLVNWRKTDDLIGHANTLVNYSYFLMAINEPFKGLASLKKAEVVFQESNDKRGLAITHIAKGNLYSTIDEKQAALKAYQFAEIGFPEDVDIIEKARIHNGLGLIYEDYKEWELSLDNRKKALNLYKTATYPQGQLATLPSLVKLNYIIGNNSQALKYFTNLQTTSTQLKDKFFLAITWKQIGDYYFKNKFDDKAVEYYQKTLKVLERFKSNIDLALIQNNLGVIYQRQSKYKLAQNMYDSSLKLSRETQDKFAEANVLYNIARLNVLKNKNVQALESIRDSIKLTEDISSDVLNSKLTRTYFTGVYSRYELYINILMKMHKDYPEKNFEIEALQASEKSRSRSILEKLMLAKVEIKRGAKSETIETEKNIRDLLSDKTRRLNQAIDENVSKEKIDSLNKEILKLTNQLEEIESLLKEQSPTYTSIKHTLNFDLSKFQEDVLDENSLLLEFTFGKEESYLWLVSKNEIDVFVLPNRKILNSKIDTLLRLLIPIESQKNEEIQSYQKRKNVAEKEYWQKAQDLSNQLFLSIIDKLGEKRLIIVPDEKLRYFPLSALPLPNNENTSKINKPFLLTNEIIYEPSASTLNLLIKKNTNKELPKRDFLVLADPVFSKYDPRFSPSNKELIDKNLAKETNLYWSDFRSLKLLDSLQRLESSEDEPKTILQNFESSNSTVISGFSANRQSFLKTNLAEYKVIHFATHGLLNEERPELSGIILSQYDELGYKRDGLIWLQDIYGLNLSADLVVLSACDTGIGKEVKGEGLMSLTNGFLQSGAKTVISSQWKVEDHATLELMNYFYQFLADENKTPSQALRKAKIKMYENSNSLNNWAAFTIHGDFQNKPKLSTRFKYLNYCLILAITFILFGLYRAVKFFK